MNFIDEIIYQGGEQEIHSQACTCSSCQAQEEEFWGSLFSSWGNWLPGGGNSSGISASSSSPGGYSSPSSSSSYGGSSSTSGGSGYSSSTRHRIEDRTAFSPTSKRKSTRNMRSVDALVLHQMGFSRGNRASRYDKVTAHFTILPDGKITQLHPISAYLWSSNGFNRRSVAVEFAGNLKSTRGKCYKPERFGCHDLTQAQIEAGRYLVKYLIDKIGLTHIFAHRQSSRSRSNDPGPDIWRNIGQWAINKYGLSDGGRTYKIGSGRPILDSWRN